MPRRGEEITQREIKAILDLKAERMALKAQLDALDVKWERLLARVHRRGVVVRTISKLAGVSPQTVTNYADKHLPQQPEQ